MGFAPEDATAHVLPRPSAFAIPSTVTSRWHPVPTWVLLSYNGKCSFRYLCRDVRLPVLARLVIYHVKLHF
jgi:hypothetical protein